MKRVTLNNKAEMPQLGFGVFQITDEKVCEESVLYALNTGYRLMDTAACYGNERIVGKAIAKSGLPREEIFLSSIAMQRRFSVKKYAKTTYENAFKKRLFAGLLTHNYSAVTATHSGEWMKRLASDTVVVSKGLP